MECREQPWTHIQGTVTCACLRLPVFQYGTRSQAYHKPRTVEVRNSETSIRRPRVERDDEPHQQSERVEWSVHYMYKRLSKLVDSRGLAYNILSNDYILVATSALAKLANHSKGTWYACN